MAKSSPLILREDNATVLLPPVYCGSIDYYAMLAAYPNAIIDTAARFDKRFKQAHRCVIADTRGKLMLTVPVNKPQSATQATWNDITVSTHDSWWNIHLTSLESAYGRTPFFEFYIDRFTPLFQAARFESETFPLMRHLAETDIVIRGILGIETAVSYSAASSAPGHGDRVDDYRRHRFGAATPSIPYYQVRAGQLGFIPELSILDLIFNLGPEAPLLIRRTQQAMSQLG